MHIHVMYCTRTLCVIRVGNISRYLFSLLNSGWKKIQLEMEDSFIHRVRKVLFSFSVPYFPAYRMMFKFCQDILFKDVLTSGAEI